MNSASIIKSHSLFWYIAFAFFLAAVAIAILRKTVEAPSGFGVTETQIKSFLTQIEKDPQIRKVETRAMVYKLADFAERGGNSEPELYYALGLRLRQEGKLVEASRMLRSVIEKKPDWSPAYNALGVVLYKLGDLDQAETVLRKAVELAPQASRPHNDLAVLLRLENRLEEALKYAKIALDLAPEDIATQNNFGNLMVAMGNYDDAAIYYERAKELDPSHPAPYYNLACVASIQKNYDKALTHLKKAIALDEAFWAEALKDPHLENLRHHPSFSALSQLRSEPVSITSTRE